MAGNNAIAAAGRKGWLSGALWVVALLAGSAAIIAWMWPCLHGEDCRGGTLNGLLMGVWGFVFIAGSILYKVRRDWPKLMAFPLEQWLYGHVVVGTLALYMVVGHSGFHLRNTVAVIAMFMLALTVVSGVAGLFLFYFLPRSIARHEIAVLIPDDLCRRLSRLHEELSELCSEKGAVFLAVFNELVIPLYRTEVGKVPLSADVTPWADRIPPGENEAFMVLAAKVEEAHDLFVLLGRHMRFRWLIRGWLLLHVPSTLGLVVFSVVHIISMTWYGVP
jgi:hypothetical protein